MDYAVGGRLALAEILMVPVFAIQVLG